MIDDYTSTAEEWRQVVTEEIARWRASLNRGRRVYCDFADREARTADGFCEFCGTTDHQPAR